MRGRDIVTGGYFAYSFVAVGALLFFLLWLLMLPAPPAQAALAAFLLGALGWLRLVSRGQLKGLTARRDHRPRVFENDALPIRLTFARGPGYPLQLLEVEDQFSASFDLHQRMLIPWLPQGWEIVLHYDRTAERHRGLYFIGPLHVRAADPLGVFYERREIDLVTSLTVYPRADPLPEYRIPSDQASPGSSLNALVRAGLGEEVLGVREYRRGDPPQRVHWPTSARRGTLHVVELDQPIQTEVSVMIDLSRRSRLGLGAEASTELAIRAGTSILTRTWQTRHRFSLAYAHHEAVFFPAGSGMANLQLFLDRLAVLEPSGETELWGEVAPRALLMAPGSRVVFVAAVNQMPLARAAGLVRRLVQSRIAVDCVLIDDRDFIRFYRDQEVDRRQDHVDFASAREALGLAGARIWPLDRRHANLAGLTPPDVEILERAIRRAP